METPVTANTRLVFVYGALMRELQYPLPAKVRGYRVKALLSSGTAISFVEPCFVVLVTDQSDDAEAFGAVQRMTEEKWYALISHERHYDAVDLGERIDFLPHPTNPNSDFNRRLTDDEPIYGLVPKPKTQLLAQEGNPSKRYSLLLVEGAKRASLPSNVVQRYEQWARQGNSVSYWLLAFMPSGSIHLLRRSVNTLGPIPTLALMLTFWFGFFTVAGKFAGYLWSLFKW